MSFRFRRLLVSGALIGAVGLLAGGCNGQGVGEECAVQSDCQNGLTCQSVGSAAGMRCCPGTSRCGVTQQLSIGNSAPPESDGGPNDGALSGDATLPSDSAADADAPDASEASYAAPADGDSEALPDAFSGDSFTPEPDADADVASPSSDGDAAIDVDAADSDAASD